MEIAKFVLTALGTFLTVLSLSFAVFQYWKKKQDEKFETLKASIKNEVRQERDDRKDAQERLEKRVHRLEENVMQEIQRRMSSLEGEFKGVQNVLKSIHEWFINNTPTGGSNRG